MHESHIVFPMLGAATTVPITENSAVSVAIFAASLAVTAGLLWRAGRMSQRIEDRLGAMEKTIERIERAQEGETKRQRDGHE